MKPTLRLLVLVPAGCLLIPLVLLQVATATMIDAVQSTAEGAVDLLRLRNDLRW